MPGFRDLDPLECEHLLRGGVVGRVALSTPDGPHIVPVSYAVVDDTVVIRTSAYSLLGSHGHNAMLAFEVDHVEHIDHERHIDWSVVARGRGWTESNLDEVARIRAGWQPRPVPRGRRHLFLRLRWESLTGHALEQDRTRRTESAVHRTLTVL